METALITAYPYATQYGTLPIPKGLNEGQKQAYVEEHWGEINFSKPELDYCGTEFDIDIEA